MVRAGDGAGGDALGVQDARDQGREVPPEGGRVLEVHNALPFLKPRARPTATTAMPDQTSGLGAGAPSRTPLTAAATGAIPVSSPARLAPSRRTLEYHSTKAAAVTATAR